MSKARELIEKYKVEEEKDGFAVYLVGGSIGDKSIRNVKQLKDQVVLDDKIFPTKEEASAKAKRMNKLLSPGEKKYYGLSYKVGIVSGGKYTGR